MKRVTYLLLCLLLLSSCSKKDEYVIKGEYESASDGTVLYISPYQIYDIDSIIVPFDSTIVKNGKFEFRGRCDGMDVCFIYSSHVIDGGFVVVEPGNINFRMSGETSRSGTDANDKLERFLAEKERLIAMRSMCLPAILDAIAPNEEMRDSIVMMANLGAMVFDLYAAKEVEENIDNALGHFMLTQAAGIASPEIMYGLFMKMPEHLHDKLYNVRKTEIENSLDEGKLVSLYKSTSHEATMFTSVGRRYVNFEMNNVRGGKTLFSDVISTNKYTVLLFWGSWDENSKLSLHELTAMCSGYADKGLALVTVSMDASVDEACAALPSTECQAYHLCNPNGGSAEVASAYGITTLPVMFVINSHGTIIVRSSVTKDIESKIKAVF